MQFPRILTGGESHIELHDMVPKFVVCDVHAHDNSQMFDITLLKKLIHVSSGIGSDKAVSYFSLLNL